MFARLTLTAAMLAVFAVVSGCTASSRSYVEENSQGFVEVRGRIQEIDSLATRQWENLSDGLAQKVGKKGCTVKIAQSETRTASYVLEPGDTIVIGGDFDFLLTRSPTEVGSEGAASASEAPAKPKPPAGGSAEDEASADGD